MNMIKNHLLGNTPVQVFIKERGQWGELKNARYEIRRFLFAQKGDRAFEPIKQLENICLSMEREIKAAREAVLSLEDDLTEDLLDDPSYWDRLCHANNELGDRQAALLMIDGLLAVLHKYNEVQALLNEKREKIAAHVITKITTGQGHSVDHFINPHVLGKAFKQVKAIYEQRQNQPRLRRAADKIAAAMNNGESPWANESPKGAKLIARGSRVIAIKNKHPVAAWEVRNIKAFKGLYKIPNPSHLKAARAAEEMNRGGLPALDQAPRVTQKFTAQGNRVLALDKEGRAVACWVINRRGRLFLRSVLSPFGTKRLKVEGNKVICLNKQGQVLEEYPSNVTVRRYRDIKRRHTSTSQVALG
jgi:hypothetical protein